MMEYPHNPWSRHLFDLLNGQCDDINLKNYFSGDAVNIFEKGMLGTLFIEALADDICEAYTKGSLFIKNDIEKISSILNDWIEYDNCYILGLMRDFVDVVKTKPEVVDLFVDSGFDIHSYNFTSLNVSNLSKHSNATNFNFDKRYYEKVIESWPEIKDPKTFKLKSYDDEFG